MGGPNRNIKDFFLPTPSTAQSCVGDEHSLLAVTTGHDAQPATAASDPSRRLVSNGEVVILNSDSDSDSLPDLDWGEPKTSRRPVVTSMHYKRSPEKNDVNGLRLPDRIAKKSKWSFDKLVQEFQQNIEMEKRIEQYKAELDKPVYEPAKGNFMIDEKTLGQVLPSNDDPEKIHRLFLALQRTNVMRTESAIYFFRDTSDSIRVLPRFPVRCLDQWIPNFADSRAREQAFLTGFAYRVFRQEELPEELAAWMLEQICFGESDALRTKYLEILELHHGHLHTLITQDKLNALFKAAGANMEYLHPEHKVVPSFEAHPPDQASLTPSLQCIARLLHIAAAWLPVKVKCHALYILCHACLDGRVLTDANTLCTIQDTMEVLICDISNTRVMTRDAAICSQLRDICSQLACRISDPVLQKNLVYALPAKVSSAALFQRRLALCFLLHPDEVDVSITDPSVMQLIHRHLGTSSIFRVGKANNCIHLAACMVLLDIAIGPGLLPIPHLSCTGNFLPSAIPLRNSLEVKEFNSRIDALARHVKLIGNSIVEEGAVADFTILDAKDNVERLCSRLEHAVRIGGRKVEDIFDDGDDDERQLKIEKFFVRSQEMPRPSLIDDGIFGAPKADGTNVWDN